MGTLRKFRMLGTQCATAAAPSSTTAAAASASCRLQRRNTLRCLLERSPSCRLLGARETSAGKKADLAERKGRDAQSLGDLFVSSPPPLGGDGGGGGGLSGTGRGGTGRSRRSEGRRVGFAPLPVGAARRFGLGSLRYRLLRRTWRPVLVSIPE